MFKNLPIKLILVLFLSFVFTDNIFSIDDEEFITNHFWRKMIKLSPPKRPRIALVLSGGGARGLAHIGVLKILHEENLPIDIIVGTSMGALIGSLYAAGVPIEKIENIGKVVGWDDLTNISDPSIIRLLLTSKLLSTKKIESYLEKNIGRVRFDELKIPFACVATDLITGEKIIFREGDVALAARASSTVPGLFDPVEFRHRYLIDGGLSDNIPTDVAELMGADYIIAVVSSSDFSKNDVKNVFMVLTQSIYIQGKLLDQHNIEIADYVIKPDVSDISVVDLRRSKECIEAGMIAAKNAVWNLKQQLLEKSSDESLFK